MAWVATAALVLGGAISGKAKNDKAQQIEDQTRKAAQATEKYSWITGQKPQEIQRAGSLFGDELQGATAGLSLGQGIRSANNANNLNAAQIDATKNSAANAADPGNTWFNILQQKNGMSAKPPTLYTNYLG